MKEIYKDIEGYEGIYQVSNFGNVKSLKFGKERLLTGNPNKTGHYAVSLNNNGIKTETIHKLVCIYFKGYDTKNKEFVIIHTDGDKKNNHVSNLYLKSRRFFYSEVVLEPKSSKYIGVCWDITRSRWKSSISINGKRKHLLYSTDELEASNAYQKALKELNKLTVFKIQYIYRGEIKSIQIDKCKDKADAIVKFKENYCGTIIKIEVLQK